MLPLKHECFFLQQVVNLLRNEVVNFSRSRVVSLIRNQVVKFVGFSNDLSKWLKKSDIPMRKMDGNVTECWKKILAQNPIHQFLVDNTKNRSLADPWVIAHALNENACVVTKEEKVTAPNSNKIKIPNVCDNMGIRWINDFQFIEELNFKFSCELP